MRLALAAAAFLLVSPASAKDITLTLNDDEQRGLIQMIDAAVKSVGLQGAEAGVYMHRKIIEAQKAPHSASAPEPPAAPPARPPEKK